MCTKLCLEGTVEHLSWQISHPLKLEGRMAVKVEKGVSEGLCKTAEDGLISLCPLNVFSTGLGNEIALDLELIKVRP